MDETLPPIPDRQTTPLGALRAARALLSDPRRWTAEYYARDEHGRQVGVFNPAAVCFCARGALLRVGPGFTVGTLGLDEVNAAAKELFGCDVVAVNDSIGREAVILALDLAISRLEVNS